MRTKDKGVPRQRSDSARKVHTGGLVLLGAAALSLLALSSTPALADRESDARKHFSLGKERYAESRFEEAITHFKSAAALKPSPILDYNIGRCYDRLGQAAEAIEAYERYLSSKTEAPNRAEVKARIEEIKASLGAGTSSHDPEPPAGSSAVAPPEGPPPSTPAAPSDPANRSFGATKSPSLSAETRVGALTTPAIPEAPSRLSEEEPGLSGPSRAAPRAVAKGEFTHEASRPYRAAPSAPSPRRDDGPIYKQWWFWVGIAAAAGIAGFIIATAATSDDAKAPSTTRPSPTALRSSSTLPQAFPLLSF